jgi:transposase-like protein
MTDLTSPIYNCPEAAREHIEAQRWPNGPVCPHCGCMERIGRLTGTKHRAGVYQCGDCREQFTVTVKTIIESSHIPLHKWVLAFHLMAASKKGISALQLQRMLGLGSYRSAWFMAHRIREAMKDTDPTPMGGEGKTVEADETFHGPSEFTYSNDAGWKKKRGAYAKPHKIMALVERGGRARSIKVEELDIATINDVLSGVDPQSTLHTDQAQHYKKPGKRFAKHESVNHSKKEYARGDVTTNTVEGYFSIFKRGMVGIYQHCGEQHLQRYLTEFDFRYSNRVALGINDDARAQIALKGIEGKRLTYRRTGGAQ